MTDKTIPDKTTGGQEHTFTHPGDAEDGHKWQTRDGRPVRIICTDVRGDLCPIVALIPAWDDGGEYPASYTYRGLFHSGDRSPNCGMDLIDAPRTRTVWVNIYGGVEFGLMYPDRAAADRGAAKRAAITREDPRTACLEITYTDGEGL